jgi:hypothetical protein
MASDTTWTVQQVLRVPILWYVSDLNPLLRPIEAAEICYGKLAPCFYQLASPGLEMGTQKINQQETTTRPIVG